MKRWTLRIFLCLVIGAMTTVAVAWGCARQARLIESTNLSRDQIRTLWDDWGISDHKYEPEYGFANFDLGVLSTSLGRSSGAAELDWEVFDFQAGLPMHSMRGRALSDLERSQPSYGLWVFDDGSIIPYSPIWHAFVIDTLFYAAIWGGVWFGFTSAKRGIRRRRGRCPRCGYDLRGAPGFAAGCSECGWGRDRSPRGNGGDSE